MVPIQVQIMTPGQLKLLHPDALLGKLDIIIDFKTLPVVKDELSFYCFILLFIKCKGRGKMIVQKKKKKEISYHGQT